MVNDFTCLLRVVFVLNVVVGSRDYKSANSIPDWSLNRVLQAKESLEAMQPYTLRACLGF
jgi:hypothetical protein